MKYRSLNSIEKHLLTSKAEQLCPVYLFLSPCSHELKELGELLKKCLGIEKASIHSAGDIEEQKLSEALRAALLFSSHNFLILRDCQSLPKNLEDFLYKEISQVDFGRSFPPTTLLLCGTKLAMRSSLYKKIEEKGIIFDHSSQKPWEKEALLVEYIQQEAQKNKKKISRFNAQILLKQNPHEKAFLHMEIKKLCTYLGQKEEIFAEHIELLASSAPQSKLWDLGKALLEKNITEALNLSHQLLAQEQNLSLLLAQLRSQIYNALHILSDWEEHKNWSTLSATFPRLGERILRNSLERSQRYGSFALRKALSKVYGYERKAKDSPGDAGALLEELCLSLVSQHF